MSTVKAVNFQHPSSSAANLTLAADGTVTGGLPAGGRNLLYNGAMQVAQRGTSTASITTSGYYTADRWNLNLGTLGTWTNSVESDAPSGSGLAKSLKILCTTANASPSASSQFQIFQRLEGQDLQRIAKGTAGAQQLTLSFWVKSNVTGTCIAELSDIDNSRQVSASYTINASATWERKIITFPADTTGAFDNDNAASLTVAFWVGGGSNFTSGTSATTWQSTTDANRAVGQTNLAAANNNYWQVTGVQLEVGPVASAFEFKPYGQELRECQRYYYRISASSNEAYATLCPSGLGWSTTAVEGHVILPVPMRVKPTSVDSGGTKGAANTGQSASISVGTSASISTAYSNASIVMLDFTGSGLTAGSYYSIIARNDSTAYLGLSAEL